MRLLLISLLCAASTSIAAAESLTVQLYDAPPKEGELTHDHVVFVKAKDGECPETHKGRTVTWHHIVVGGNLHQGISRSTRKCVVVSENPTKAADASWQHERVASTNGKPAADKAAPVVAKASVPAFGAAMILDREPGRGQLAARTSVLVRFSDRISCNKDQLIKVTGADDKEGRRKRECVR